MSVILIVESPNKAKSIAKYFPEFRVMATTKKTGSGGANKGHKADTTTAAVSAANPKSPRQAKANTKPVGAPCPQCAVGVLQLRTVKYGDRVGLSFFGCTNYPKCRHTENVPLRSDPISTNDFQ
jgi:ssDNA-binding Zn-finger/Zn-ribbon topoisomerase 1